MNAYLDGLLTSNVTSYWEYINVETLLSLQRPKTDFPDELIFIIYHQITELYFKLSLHELVQIVLRQRVRIKGGMKKLTLHFLQDVLRGSTGILKRLQNRST
jgi:tryptophan 2,3-dioxygenase